MITAVVFDLGETLVDETRYWTEWARRLGLTPLNLLAQLGAAIERGEDHQALLARAGATGATVAPDFDAADLYQDARAVLESLRGAGLTTAVAGNFGRSTAERVRTWGLAVDAVMSSDDLGAAKPVPAFFLSLAERLGVSVEELLYVGDRIDNDVDAALDAGCRAVFLRRGPWAAIQERTAHVRAPSVDGLAEVLPLLGR